MSAGTILAFTHSKNIDELGGLAQRMPTFSKIALALTVAAAALPPFGAFISEWILLQGSVMALPHASLIVQGILVILIASVAFTGGTALFAMTKFFGLTFLGEPRTSGASKVTEPDALINIPLALAAIGVLCVGIFAPNLATLFPGYEAGTTLSGDMTLTIASASFYPAAVAGTFVVLILLVWGLRRLLSDVKNERLYHTWDCGQPINASMEYTGTAFSAPFRCVFRVLLHIHKEVTITRPIEGNLWIKQHSIRIVRDKTVISVEFIYDFIKKAALFLSQMAGKIQNGIIQFYIGLIFLALILTIIIAL